MWKKGFRFMVVFTSGYLFIYLLPIDQPFIISESFVELVINPFKFFLAILVFLIGLIINAQLIRETLQETKKNWKEKKGVNDELIVGYLGLILVFYFLFKLELMHSLVFFSFSMLYGIISIDFLKE